MQRCFVLGRARLRHPFHIASCSRCSNPSANPPPAQALPAIHPPLSLYPRKKMVGTVVSWQLWILAMTLAVQLGWFLCCVDSEFGLVPVMGRVEIPGKNRKTIWWFWCFVPIDRLCVGRPPLDSNAAGHRWPAQEKWLTLPLLYSLLVQFL